MTEEKLYIDGKLVTATNAWRFVKARRPNADAHRERAQGWHRSNYSVVSDRTRGAPWCHATGKTAGEAWLKAARQMVEYDARIAAEKRALDVVRATLASAESPADREAAALRYAAVRIEQIGDGFGGERKRWSDLLRALAEPAQHEDE